MFKLLENIDNKTTNVSSLNDMTQVIPFKN